MAISLSNRRCPYEFNALIDCWLKTTGHYDVIAPSTVSNTQNAKLLTSRNLCHSLMLCRVTRSQRMGECETLRWPTRIDQSHRYGHPQAACREPAGSYDKTTRTAICFEHKTQYLLIRAPYTRIVVFWHISNIPRHPWFRRVKLVVIPPRFI